MTRTPSAITQAAIERTIRALKAQGVYGVTRIEIDAKTGTISLVPDRDKQPEPKRDWEEHWDGV